MVADLKKLISAWYREEVNVAAALGITVLSESALRD